MEHQEVLEAEFSTDLKIYWFVVGILSCILTVVLLPLLPVWLLLGWFYLGVVIDHMHCSITDKSLVFNKGILFRLEKTIPLEKITDMALRQGPVMRMMNLYLLSVETAGQSGSGSLLKIMGIEDTLAFRDKVLARRDQFLVGRQSSGSGEGVQPSSGQEVFLEIRDSLLRIEDKLGRQGSGTDSL